LLKKYIQRGVWRVAVCPSYIQDARFLKVKVICINTPYRETKNWKFIKTYPEDVVFENNIKWSKVSNDQTVWASFLRLLRVRYSRSVGDPHHLHEVIWGPSVGELLVLMLYCEYCGMAWFLDNSVCAAATVASQLVDGQPVFTCAVVCDAWRPTHTAIAELSDVLNDSIRIVYCPNSGACDKLGYYRQRGLRTCRSLRRGRVARSFCDNCMLLYTVCYTYTQQRTWSSWQIIPQF
jgi:hypothetical protein